MLTRNETVSDRLLKAQDTVKIMALLIVLMVATLGFAVSLIGKDMQVIAEQDKALAEQGVRIEELAKKNAELTEKVAVLEVKAMEVVSRGSDTRRLTAEEMRELAGVVHAEAKGEPALGKLLVAKVALNRLRWNPGLTMHEILTKENQFAAWENYTAEDMDAVHDAMTRATQYDQLAGFHNPRTATNPEAKERKILLEVGNHVFW